MNAYFRIPPDLYYETGDDNARLHLAYRYNSVPIGANSSLQVRLNSAFVGSVPLVPGQDASRATQTDVAVPVANLRPFSNTLSFDTLSNWPTNRIAITARPSICREQSFKIPISICAATPIGRRCPISKYSPTPDSHSRVSLT